MKIDGSFGRAWSRCILSPEGCDGPLTTEHVIPEQIGGKLTADFLCKRHNSTLGARVESEVRKDPMIRYAASELHHRIPALSKDILRGQPLRVTSAAGVVRGYLKGKDLKTLVVPHQGQPDGSVSETTNEVRRRIRGLLRPSDASESEIERTQASFDDAPTETPAELSPGTTAVKRKVTGLGLDLSIGALLSDLVLLKIAFEFLAIALGDTIYKPTEPLADVRQYLKGPAPTPRYGVDRLRLGDKYEPLHVLRLRTFGDGTDVDVILFGLLLDRVHLSGVELPRPHLGYVHNLQTGVEEWFESNPNG